MTNYPIIANSLPLGGPFLLMKVLDSFGFRKYDQQPGTPQAFNYKEVKEILALQTAQDLTDNPIPISPFAPCYVNQCLFRQWLGALLPGQYISAHIPYTESFAPLITELNYRHIVIMRDFRAILAELVYGDEIMPRFLKADIERMSLAERLHFFLNGGYASQTDLSIKSFAEIYRSMQAWRDDPSCLVVDFEDLVNKDRQQATLIRMAEYLSVSIENMTSSIAAINSFPLPDNKILEKLDLLIKLWE